MGLSVREMLQDDFFKECRVIAGHAGMDKQIQGVAVLDAPDGINFTQGRELIISSGYVFQQNPNLFEDIAKFERIVLTSGFGIKERYLKDGFPKPFLDFCEQNAIPLIVIPPQLPWMDLMNHLNIIVMNKNIRCFNVDKSENLSFTDSNYQLQMIHKILSQMEREMHFPALLYEIDGDNIYYSSQNVHMPVKELELKHFWQPLDSFAQEVLCEELNMVRYRYSKDENGIPYSWITVPVTLKGGTLKAYFTVIESTGLIDYFDQFSIRIGFLLLQSMYEQILMVRRLGDAGFKKMLLDVLHGTLDQKEEIERQAAEAGLDENARYYMMVIQQRNASHLIANHAQEMRRLLDSCKGDLKGKLALVEDNLAVFIFYAGENNNADIQKIRNMLDLLGQRIKKALPKFDLLCGIADTPFFIADLKRNFERCQQTLQMGSTLAPERKYYFYTELGIFAWLTVKKDDENWILKDFEALFNGPNSREWTETLSAYLACNMNYSLTAKKLYMHINTVRKRVQEIEDCLQCDLTDPMARLNLEILLKLYSGNYLPPG